MKAHETAAIKIDQMDSENKDVGYLVLQVQEELYQSTLTFRRTVVRDHK